MRLSFLPVLFAFTLFVVGCASESLVVGSAGTIPDGKRVRLLPGYPTRDGTNVGIVVVTQVDDESTKVRGCLGNCDPKELLLTAGRHHLKLHLEYFGNYFDSEVDFNAEEGKNYVVRRRLSGYSASRIEPNEACGLT